jgi:glycosyltransferase involved in cell wall biosynthesis
VRRHKATLIPLKQAPHVDPLYNEIRRVLRGDINFTDKLQVVNRMVSAYIPFLTDEYSKLRYTLFILQKLTDFDMEYHSLPVKNPVVKFLLQEFFFSKCVKHRKHVTDFFEKPHDIIERAACMKGALLCKTLPSPDELLDQTGFSVYTDSLVRDIVRDRVNTWDHEELKQCIHTRINRACESPKKIVFLLDVASEHGLNALSDDETESLFSRWKQDDDVYMALMRYIGECNLGFFLPFLHRTLQHTQNTSPARIFCVIDTLGMIGDDTSLELLNRYTSMLKGKERIFLEDSSISAIKEILRRKNKVTKTRTKSLVPAQFAFHSRVGEAEGSGLSTFLSSMGYRLSEMDMFEKVYTFTLYPLLSPKNQRPMMEAFQNDKHCIVRIPTFFPFEDLPYKFLLHEYELMRGVRRAMERCVIDPDIFHVRYSDNASKAVAVLSKKLGKKLIFTLTPDPHRNLTGDDGRMLSPNDESVLSQLNRVFIADRTVDSADGILLIGNAWENDQISPYFPNLWLKGENRKKPLQMLPEGIDINPSVPVGKSTRNCSMLLCNHQDHYRLYPLYQNRPMLLNVGRLHPIKGQHRLVESWVNSAINEIYNLVLIGGKLDNPCSTEKQMIENIETSVYNNKKTEGRFCHLRALPNEEVRLFEQSVINDMRSETPHVYVCSSLKEEFGISILEAMSCGFLVIAPLNGGAKNYIRNGKSGFLIRTHDAQSLKEDMEEVLLSGEYSVKKLRSIAKCGKKFVTLNFNIKKIARCYADFYRRINNST